MTLELNKEYKVEMKEVDTISSVALCLIQHV